MMMLFWISFLYSKTLTQRVWLHSALCDRSVDALLPDSQRLRYQLFPHLKIKVYLENKHVVRVIILPPIFCNMQSDLQTRDIEVTCSDFWSLGLVYPFSLSLSPSPYSHTHTHTPQPSGSYLLYGNTANPVALRLFLLNQPTNPAVHPSIHAFIHSQYVTYC